MDRVFTSSEISQRVSRAQVSVREAGLAAAIFTRPENIYYLTGFRASHFAAPLSELHALVLPADAKPRLLARALERQIAELQWSDNPSLYMDHEDPYSFLDKIFADFRISEGRVGIEERYLSVRQFQIIRMVLPFAEFTDVSGLIEGHTLRTTSAEIECLRNAAKVTNVGFETGLAAVRDGVYPYEIVGAIHEAMYKAGQSDFDMSMVCVWAGEKGGRMHDTRANERINAGDAVTIEIFGVDKQYKVGAQGTIFVNRKPAEDVQQRYALLVDMFKAARSAVRAGASAGDIYDAANAPYKRAFGSDYFRKTGGSMGLTIFGVPLVKGRKDVLEAGMCLLLQVLVDDPTLITCSSSVLVTDTGCEILTPSQEELRVV